MRRAPRSPRTNSLKEHQDEAKQGEVLQPPTLTPEGYGFFCRVPDRQHFDRIRAGIKKNGYFTDRVLFDRVSVRSSDLALIISPDGDLAYAAHIRPTRMGTTGNRGFRAESPVNLDITQQELEGCIDPKSWDEIKRGFVEPAFRPEGANWAPLWKAIKWLRPSLYAELRRLEQLRFDEAFEFDDRAADVQHYYEKDAVGVALQIGGIDYHGVFAELSDGLKSGKSLLQSLCGNTTEDVHIDHDVHNFPGFFRTEDQLHACTFTQHGRTLSIYNVNRRRAEAALGVDLIYRNAEFGGFTFVQYKMLNQEGRGAKPKWVYRPDTQFYDEFARMKAAHRVFSEQQATHDPASYRLSFEAFYFKFCRRQHQKVNAGALVHGHYLGLSHLELILKSGGRGNQGGLALGPSNMARWLTRTDFAALVANGWIGTVNLTDGSLAEYIDNSLDAGKSVVVAVGSGRRSSGEWGDDERD